MTAGCRCLSILGRVGRKNYLIEGLSGTGKTSVAEELQRRGHHVVHGDRELAYQGDCPKRVEEIVLRECRHLRSARAVLGVVQQYAAKRENSEIPTVLV